MKDVANIDLPEGKLFVGGQWECGTGPEITSVFPADGTVNRVLRGASAADGLRAIERAKAAQADPAWRGLKPHERARLLHRIADGIEANAGRIAAIQSRDTGKILRETGALAASAAGTFRYFAAVLESTDDLLTTPRGQSHAELQSWWLMLSLSLLVAAVGVLNAMLMAVTQRYREIGTIKCLGGLDRLILLSVLTEALLVGVAGAVSGAVVGLIAGWAVNTAADVPGEAVVGLPLRLVLVLGIALALTGLGAALPAFLASKMPPIDAMRGEK